MSTITLKLEFTAEFMRETRIHGKRFNRTRNEQLLHWINMGKRLDDEIHKSSAEIVSKLPTAETLFAHYAQRFKSMNTSAARTKAKEAFDAGPESFERSLESDEPQIPALGVSAAPAFVKAGLSGRKVLIGLDGGCVNANSAAILYAGARSNTPTGSETVLKAARTRKLISIRGNRGKILFPVWQFKPGAGGPLPKLPAVLKELARRPGYSEITPFLFFLLRQPRLRTTPLHALRKGQISEVIAAAREYCF